MLNFEELKALPADVALTKVDVASQNRDFMAALQLIQHVLSIQPDNSVVRGRLTEVSELAKKEKARIEKNEKPPESNIKEIASLIFSEQHAKAQRECQKLMERFPKSDSLMSLLGVSMAGEGRFADAVGVFDSGIRNNPYVSELHRNRAQALFDQGLPDAALVGVELAILICASCEDDNVQAVTNLTVRGNILRETGKLQEALASYDEATEVKDDNANTYYNRGKTRSLLGEWDAAIDDFGTAVSLDATDEDYWLNLMATMPHIAL